MTTSNGAMVVAGPTLAKATERVDLSVKFTREQRDVILDTCCGGASATEAHALIAIAEARGLNPILGECYFVKRWDNEAKRFRWAVQAAIDSLRIKAEQTGLYAGQDEPEYEYDEHGRVALARVKVWRKDWPRPAVGVARWSEYVQLTKDQQPTKFWRQMPHNQLAKCAEALALRKAFPTVLAKVYVAEEMAQADNEVAYAPQMPPAREVPKLAPAAEADPGAFAAACERLDAAETAAAINAVAAAVGRAHKAGRITDGQFAAMKTAVEKKRALIGAPRPPPSEPKVEDEAEGVREHQDATGDYQDGEP